MTTPTTERTSTTTERTLPRLKQRYRDEIAPALRKEFRSRQRHADPRSGQDRGEHGCR